MRDTWGRKIIDSDIKKIIRCLFGVYFALRSASVDLLSDVSVYSRMFAILESVGVDALSCCV